MSVTLVAVVGVVAFLLFFTEWIPPAATAVGVAAALMLLGILTPSEGLSGFSNEATITVVCMLALAGGVQKTGLVNKGAHRLMQAAHGSVNRFRTLLLLLAGAVSSVLNNTPVVAVMTPVTVSVAQRLGRPASQFLLPMAYASTLGGMLTLVGTSTTVLASSVWAGMGNQRWRMFQFTHIGALVFVVGIAYLLMASKLVRGGQAPKTRAASFVFELRAPEGSPLIGQWPEDCDLLKRHDLQFRALMRQDRAVGGPIDAGDVLVLEGGLASILRLRDIDGLKLRPEEDHWLPEGSIVAEAVVTPGSLLDGRSLQEVRFRGRYDAVALAARRRHAPIRRLGSARLVGGDVLLLRGTPEALRAIEDQMHLLVPGDLAEEYRRDRAPHILIIVAAVVLLAAFDVLPLVVAALAGVVAAVVTGCLRLHEFQDVVRWDIVLLIAGLIPLGVAMEKTGAGTLLATWLAAQMEGWPAMAIVAALYLTTMVLTEALSNNATIVVMLPLSVAVASAAGLDPFPVAVAVTFAATLAFMTPIGYQTHMIVFGPGGYRFSDYLRLGTPLNLLTGAAAITAIHLTWPFA